MKRVLIVDDLPEKGAEIADELQRRNQDIQKVDFARCYTETISFLEKNEYDLMILDMTLPRELNKGSELNTYAGKEILYDMLGMRKFVPSIVVTRYTYFGNYTEPMSSHTKNFCLENSYFMKDREEVLDAKYDLSSYRGLHDFFSQNIPFYAGMLYYNPSEDKWKDTLNSFMQKIKEGKNEYTGVRRYRREEPGN